jgi:hypothetical protein
LAKQRQRSRQRSEGLAPCQVTITKALVRPLLEATRRPDTAQRLQEWLALEVIDLEQFPQLRLLAWSRRDRWISGAEALALYERNWRFVDPAELTVSEAQLIRGLTMRHGNGVLNV